MANPRAPILRATAVTDAGATEAFGAVGRMGAVYMINAGPDAVFLNFTAAFPVATLGDGRKRLQLNEALNLDDIDFIDLSFRTAAAETATVEIIALPRPGSSGAGMIA